MVSYDMGFPRTDDSIVGLVERLEELSQEEKKLFDSMFRVWRYTGDLKVPRTFEKRVEEYYKEYGEKAVERVSRQTILKTVNLWTGEGALFNQLRAGRPGQTSVLSAEKRQRLLTRVREAKNDCDFCHPITSTPEDLFGRVEGKHCITAANIAKYDAYSGLVIFDEHNPLEFSREQLSDYVDVALKWYRKVHEREEEFRYPFFGWNCLEKAGASQVHGHAQVLIARDMPYAKVAALVSAAERYKRGTGRDYFDALYRAHESVGLGTTHGQTRLFASVTPVKEREMMLISPSVSEELKATVFEVLRGYIDEVGVASFNLSMAIPPIGGEEEVTPVVTRVVDRGDVSKMTSDLGGMELYGSNVIASDPYVVFHKVAGRLSNT